MSNYRLKKRENHTQDIVHPLTALVGEGLGALVGDAETVGLVVGPGVGTGVGAGVVGEMVGCKEEMNIRCEHFMIRKVRESHYLIKHDLLLMLEEASDRQCLRKYREDMSDHSHEHKHMPRRG